MQQYQLTFIDLALTSNALRFGRFTLKSGRESPYFFNAGVFNDGESVAVLGRCYGAAIMAAGLAFDMLFGPAYKGIPLVTGTAIALSLDHGLNMPYAFNRKEAKHHGEGGSIIGAPLKGRVLIVDDVISAGTAVRESLALIRAADAQPVGVALALDRQERGQGALSAVQEVEQAEGLRCVSIVTLTELIATLTPGPDGRARISDDQLTALRAYQERYGVR
jgi:orotate phosphoribosyltransferase